MKKLIGITALLVGMAGVASAETATEVEEVSEATAVQETQETTGKAPIELPQWVKNIKFSGYGILQYQGEDTEGNHTNSFNLDWRVSSSTVRLATSTGVHRYRAPTILAPDSPPYSW